MAKRLEQHYPVLFRGPAGTCAHEFILDIRWVHFCWLACFFAVYCSVLLVRSLDRAAYSVA